MAKRRPTTEKPSSSSFTNGSSQVTGKVRTRSCLASSSEYLNESSCPIATYKNAAEEPKKYKGTFEVPNLSEENDPSEVDVSGQLDG